MADPAARNVVKIARLGGSNTAATAVIVLGPLLTAVALRLPPVNQLEYADAWFYSAYAWAPQHHFAVFDWNYFSVRFPAILSIGVFERVFGAQEGYVVLRYLLATATGLALYLGVRRFASAVVAAAATALLYLNPYFSRMLLWDYASFIAVSAGVAGFALWWWSDGRRPAWALLPGAALALALYANVIIATALVVLFAVELGAALRTGRDAALLFARRVGVAAASAILLLITGYLSYLRFSSATPDDLLRPTIDFLLSNEENSSLYQRPVSDWLGHELRIWVPVVTSLALIAVLRRRILGADVPARVAQVCIGYTAFLWLYRFTVTSSVIETWWAYSIVVVVLAPAVGVLLQALAAQWRSDRSVALTAVAATALGALAIRTLETATTDVYEEIATRQWLLLTVVALSLAVSLLVAARLAAVRGTALVALFVALTLIAWAPSVLDGRGTTGVFVRNGELEWDAYEGGKEFVELIRDYDSRSSRVYTWYPDPMGPESIGWTTLPHLGYTVHVIGLPAAMDTLAPLGRARLLQPDAAYVLALSEEWSDVVAARRALTAAGFRGRALRAGTLADGRLRYALIALTRKPPS